LALASGGTLTSRWGTSNGSKAAAVLTYAAYHSVEYYLSVEFMKFSRTIAFFTVVLSATAGMAYAQICPPVGVYYVVRAEDGMPLSSAELESITKQLPKTIGGATNTAGAATVTISSVPANEDGTLQPISYFGEKSPKTIPALSFSNAYPCSVHLEAVTLMLYGKTMRLIFNLGLDARGIRTLVIDSLPFQQGTFALDPPSAQTVIPTHLWKKVSNTARPSARQ
jgi:hypothetical protein